jgi:hypothetical protein
MIEPDHHICADKLVDEVRGFALRKDAILTRLGTVSHRDGDPHFVFVSPTTHVVGGALSFEIKIDDVLGHADRELRLARVASESKSRLFWQLQQSSLLDFTKSMAALFP